MSDHTNTCTIRLDDYLHLQKHYEESNDRFDTLKERIWVHDKVFAEELRDDGLFDKI